MLNSWEKYCDASECENVCDYAELFCEEHHRTCSVCGDEIEDIYEHGHEHMCGYCRDKTVAQCTCVCKSGNPITYDEVCLTEECRMLSAFDHSSVWECACCKQPMFVSHNRDGKIVSLHEREKELDMMAAFYGAT